MYVQIRASSLFLNTYSEKNHLNLKINYVRKLNITLTITFRAVRFHKDNFNCIHVGCCGRKGLKIIIHLCRVSFGNIKIFNRL